MNNLNDAETLNQPEVVNGEVKSENEVDVRVATLEAENDELQQQLLRHLADFQNFRRRTEQEKSTIRQMATEDLVVQLLPVLDNFERALESAANGASTESIVEGLKMVDRQMRIALEGQRVEKIAALGTAFDPDFHEAIATEETHDHPEDTVVHEIQSGYKMADRVIRPARVKVSKKPSGDA